MSQQLPTSSVSAKPPRRREFLRNAAGVGAALGGVTTLIAADSQQRLPIALIGAGGMGMNHLRQLARRSDVDIAWVCDVDNSRLQAAAALTRELSGHDVQVTSDMRRVLDDRKIEAVWIATPDHWHAPAAILALQAGKHVYVEKPCCHNLHEGQLLEQAVARSGKQLQVGTQSRSSDCVREAIRRVHHGEIGQVLVAKAWNSQRRGSIGRLQSADPPPDLDYDLWLGPAQPVPYRANLLHGTWRWWYDFGCGDIGNDGVHDIDVAVWGLGVSHFPSSVTCIGNKCFFDDDQQFPDTQYSVVEFQDAQAPRGTRQLIFEQRIWSPYVQEGYENGAAFYGTDGYVVIGHNVGWKLYGPRNELRAQREGRPELSDHYDNFLQAIRDDSTTCNADIAAGRLSAGIVHLSNIAARIGRVIRYDPLQHTIVDDPPASGLMHREYRSGHWASPRSV
ncbi:MAG: Gfo/Idh/MocA family oxidoreductase [Pirellulaceae bacterium]|nr:Gfo/Idh/MocA family oxidoreductase [Pirellulaceae bacterium]